MTSSSDFTWADAAGFGVLMMVTLVLIAIAASAYVQLRKARIAADQLDDYRQLVRRYEQLAEGAMDAQQRAAADIAELRTRSASIEQLLRTVE